MDMPAQIVKSQAALALRSNFAQMQALKANPLLQLPRGERVLEVIHTKDGKRIVYTEARGTRLGRTSLAGRPHKNEREIARRSRQNG